MIYQVVHVSLHGCNEVYMTVIRFIEYHEIYVLMILDIMFEQNLINILICILPTN